MVRESGRDVAVLQTIASEGTGIDDVMVALTAARASESSNAGRAVRFEVVRNIRDAAVRRALAVLDAPRGRSVLERLRAGELTRLEAREELLVYALAEVINAD